MLLNSRQIFFVYSIFFICPIVLKFYTEHGSIGKPSDRGGWTSFCETCFYDQCLRDILDCNNPKFPSGKIAFVWSTGSHGNCRTHCRLRKAVNCDDRIVRPTTGVIFVHHRSIRPPCGSSTRLARYYIGELPESIRHLAAARIWDFSLMAEQVRSEWGRTKHAWGRCDQVTCLTQPAYFYPWK